MEQSAGKLLFGSMLVRCVFPVFNRGQTLWLAMENKGTRGGSCNRWHEDSFLFRLPNAGCRFETRLGVTSYRLNLQGNMLGRRSVGPERAEHRTNKWRE